MGDVNLKINFMMDVLDFLPLESPKPSSSAILGWEARFLDALTAASSAKTTSSTACESSASSSGASIFPFPLLWSEEADDAPWVPFCSTGFLAKISSISLAGFFLLKMSSISVEAFGWLVEAVETRRQWEITEHAHCSEHEQLPFALELLFGLSDLDFLVGMTVNVQ